MSTEKINSLTNGIVAFMQSQDVTFGICFTALSNALISLTVESIFREEQELSEEKLVEALKAFAEYNQERAVETFKAMKEQAAAAEEAAAAEAGQDAQEDQPAQEDQAPQ